MNEIIAYALVIFGLPIVIGGFIGLLFAFLPDPINEAINGIISTLSAFVIFYLFKAKITLIVPIIIAFITVIWLIKRKEYKAILWQIVGIAISTLGYYLLHE